MPWLARSETVRMPIRVMGVRSAECGVRSAEGKTAAGLIAAPAEVILPGSKRDSHCLEFRTPHSVLRTPMRSWSFQSARGLTFGRNAATQIPDIARGLGARRMFVVTDAVLDKAG